MRVMAIGRRGGAPADPVNDLNIIIRGGDFHMLQPLCDLSLVRSSDAWPASCQGQPSESFTSWKKEGGMKEWSRVRHPCHENFLPPSMSAIHIYAQAATHAAGAVLAEMVTTI